MPTFTYLGLTKGEKKTRLDKQMRNPMVPPEVRGQPFFYKITKEDEEDEREEKRERTKKWKEARRKELIEGIEAADKQVVFVDPSDPGANKMLVFPKDVPVYLDEDHPIIKKLQLMSVGVKQPKKHQTHQMVTHEAFLMEEGDTTKKKDPPTKK